MTAMRFYAQDADGVDIRTAPILRTNPFGAELDTLGRPIRKGTFRRYRRGFERPYVGGRFGILPGEYYVGCAAITDRIQWVSDNTKGCWMIFSYTAKAARRVGAETGAWWFALGFEDQGDAAKYRMVWE